LPCLSQTCPLQTSRNSCKNGRFTWALKSMWVNVTNQFHERFPWKPAACQAESVVTIVGWCFSPRKHGLNRTEIEEEQQTDSSAPQYENAALSTLFSCDGDSKLTDDSIVQL
jgi:hypothetical protein